MVKNLYPPKFRRQYKNVKYESDGDGIFTFNYNARGNDVHFVEMRISNVKSKVTKNQAITWAKKQIDIHPGWIKQAEKYKK